MPSPPSSNNNSVSNNALWRIVLLGGLSARQNTPQGEKIITRFRAHKYGGLIAHLAYHLPQMQSREVLIATYWPEMEERVGRANLSNALSSLRNQLEPPGTPQGAVIQADRHSVGVNPDTVTTDVREFERLLREAESTGSKRERAQNLVDALALYGGPLLPGHYEAWITPEQERLSGLFFDAVGELIAVREQNGDLAGAVSIARRAVAVDPLREDGQEHLIRLLAASGKGGAALRQYKEFERLVEEELGDEPPASLRALSRRIEKEMGGLGSLGPATVAAAPQAPRKSRPSVAPSATVLPVSPNRSVTVNFLFTDIAESTRQWEKSGAEFTSALEMHHRLLRQVFTRYGGQEVSEAGDGFVVAFASARDALLAAVDAQRALTQHVWPPSVGALKVRMALHTGDVEFKDGEYHGLPLHRASRMLTAAHGGQILLSEVTAGVVRRDLDQDLRLVDLGVYRLRDVPTAERLFQMEWPDMDSHDFGPLAAEAGHGAHLPQTFTRFFGREREINELAERLRTPGTRLVTITGTGGSGKTRLSLEVAHRVEEHFHGAVWFAALADISDPALIPGTILDSLHVSRSPQSEPLDQVLEHLQKQPSLLVLDNLEHLIEGSNGGGAQVVQTLLQRVPGLVLLVTSRQLLGLSAEREFVLLPLPTPHGQNGGPETLSTYDSVALFIDRAQTAQPDFQINNTNAPAVAELVSRLEGIPLAIELAAARAQVLSPAQMLHQLGHRLDTLVSRKRDVSERQRTLRGAIDWSYRLLSPQLQRFFTCLSMFRGGWTSEAAEAVCEEPLALDYLAQLREASLIQSGEEAGEIRFSMLETLREYGQEQLDKKNSLAVRDRHVDYFARLAAITHPLWEEADNIHAAFDWALEHSDLAVRYRLANKVAHFWWGAGRTLEALRALLNLLSSDLEALPSVERANTLSEAASLFGLQGDYGSARPLLEESLRICQAVGNVMDTVQAQAELGILCMWEGNYGEARIFLDEALDAIRKSNDDWKIGDTCFYRAHLALRERDFALARTLYEETARRIPSWFNVCQLRLADVAFWAGEIDRARELAEDYQHNKVWGPQRKAEVLYVLAGIAVHDNKPDVALKHLAESLSLFQEFGMRDHSCRVIRRMAGLAQGLGQNERAARLLGVDETARERWSLPIPPMEREEHDPLVARLEADVSDQAVAAAWESGRAMTWEQAITYALEEGST